MPPALRFLHTADWHLGQPYKNVGSLAEDLREARLLAVERLLKLAVAAEIPLVLVAGDQFDCPLPDPEWVERLLEIIAAHPSLTLHMIPGNHDPIDPGSVYGGMRFRNRPSNLLFFETNTAHPLPEWNATLFACPCTARDGPDPLTWIPPRSPDHGLRVALAHGSRTDIPSTDPNYPIDPDAPRRYDLDYIALGDWHRPNPNPAKQPSARMYYSGAPECGGWDEQGVGQALVVELAVGAPPRVTEVSTSGRVWETIEETLSDASDVNRLLGRLNRDDSSTRLVRLHLDGRLDADDRERLERELAVLTPRFALLTTDLSGVSIDVGDIDALSSDPRVRRIFDELSRLLNDPSASGPTLPDGLPALDPAIITRAWKLARSKLD